MKAQKNNLLKEKRFDAFINQQRFSKEKERSSLKEEIRALLVRIQEGVKFGFAGNKIYTGELSPGCLICARGGWSCIFVNNYCTRRCFFCPQARTDSPEATFNIEEGPVFRSAEKYADYLSAFKMRGASFSGGEPLLTLERVLLYIKEVRSRLGKNFYLWLYSNGDLVKKKSLLKLRDAGLDEIRFNITSRRYDIRPVAASCGVIKTVTVEIPVIPEDQRTISRKLKALQNAGVKHINLHQLYCTEDNYPAFRKRGYIFDYHQPSVLKSELAVLRIINYALSRRINIPINYCSALYKERVQRSSRRRKKAVLTRGNHDTVTDAGYIRNISKSPIQKDNQRSIANKISINYYSPVLRSRPQASAAAVDKRGICSSKKEIYIQRRPVLRIKNPSNRCLKAFHRIFIKGGSEQKVLSRFFQDYPFKKSDDFRKMKREIGLLKKASNFELIEKGPL